MTWLLITKAAGTPDRPCNGKEGATESSQNGFYEKPQQGALGENRSHQNAQGNGAGRDAGEIKPMGLLLPACAGACVVATAKGRSSQREEVATGLLNPRHPLAVSGQVVVMQTQPLMHQGRECPAQHPAHAHPVLSSCSCCSPGASRAHQVLRPLGASLLVCADSRCLISPGPKPPRAAPALSPRLPPASHPAAGRWRHPHAAASSPVLLGSCEAGIKLLSCFLLSTEFGMEGILSPHPVGTQKAQKPAKPLFVLEGRRPG